ncbi:MAG: GNAT family N-acetyltransferase [Gemmatimonadota bacterium]|nr:MAG: GNAT family N-acetyltransferase [Gemmatimonadota bacterium]
MAVNELDTILNDFSQPKVERAIERNIIEQYPFIFSSLPDFEMIDTGRLVWFVTGLNSSYLNYVLLGQFKLEEIDTGIETTLQEFRTRRVPMTWSVGPSTEPINIGKHLVSHGLVHTRTETGMAVDLQEMKENFPAPPGLSIEQIRDEDGLQKWFRVVAASFAYQNTVVHILSNLYSRLACNRQRYWQLFTGFVDQKPVGASRLFTGAGVAGIYHVATVPEMRGRGIGTAMTLAPLREARDLGYRIGVLRAAERALGVYKRIGFQEICSFHFYLYSGGRG